MNEAPELRPMPDDAAMRRRTVIAAVAGVAVVVIVMVGSWVALGRQQAQAPKPRTFVPAQETSALPLPSGVPTSSTPTAEPSTSPATPKPQAGSTSATETPVPSTPKIAFRLGQTLYLANEDGSEAIAVNSSADGPYAASPDGTSIAWVDGGSHDLKVATLGSRSIDFGPALKVQPVWLADSSGVLFARQATSGEEPQVMKVGRTGGTPAVVGTGDFFSAGPQGAIAVGPTATGSSDRTVEVLKGGKRTSIQAPGVVTGIGLGKDRIFIGVSEPASVYGVWSFNLDRSDGVQVVKGPLAGQQGAVADLKLSPTGKDLAFALTGDDGYSRLFAVPAIGGTPKLLSIRRDGYPLGWTADGTSITFIEGNEFQGEPTALMRVHPDGTARFMIVSGAAL